jgi:IMP dehydrogenase
MKRMALTYDDIQLIPGYSSISTRQNINLRTLVSRRYGILNPFVASPMDTVCEEEMAFKMFLMGGVGCIHRFMTIEDQVGMVRRLSGRIYGEGFDGPYRNWGITDANWHSEIPRIPIMAAIGVMSSDMERAKSLTEAGANIILIDVAHGHHENVIAMIKWCKEHLPEYVDIIAGNIATAQAAIDLEEAGADGLRVGIGGGSLCTTRIKTGFGIPNVTSIIDIAEVAKTPVMADGGIRSSGDIAKALAVGASCVMLGSLLSGTDEAPGQIVENSYRKGLFKRYRGAASLETKTVHGQAQRNIEGESTMVPYKGGVKFILNGLIDGVRSALSYAGSNDLYEYRPDYIQVTNAGINEANPHLL